MSKQTFYLQGQYQARVYWNTQASGAAFDRKKRSFLSPEAQEFLTQRIMCVLAGLSEPASLSSRLIFGAPGFARSPDPFTCLLELDEASMSSALITRLQQCSSDRQHLQLGLCFLSHATRQRLCIHGNALIPLKRTLIPHCRATKQTSHLLHLEVEQAFFHCPKYIRTAIAGLTVPPVMRLDRTHFLQAYRESVAQGLTPDLLAFLQQQAVCFLCTVNRQGVCAINHRGGAPGFLHALLPDAEHPGGRLLLPDYKGNGAFEAIGNILENGLVTLLVPDYSLQVALSIAGHASVLEWRNIPSDIQSRCPGAERVIDLTITSLALQQGDWTLPLAHEQATAHLSAWTEAELVQERTLSTTVPT